LFVTHGGVNSVNESLIHGKPMLVVHWGGDRMEMAKRVEYHGAGISLDVDEATVGRIRKDVIALLKQPRYTRAAEGIMHSYKRCGGSRTAADLIERLAETRKPVLRRKGSPIVLEDSGNLPDVLEI
ncbi:MAG: hypothetical protein JW920_03840, partial [Deltaproteobacteria bacterium]|nr:hypothetical protein [Deltaproteobacteria bacterium]